MLVFSAVRPEASVILPPSSKCQMTNQYMKAHTSHHRRKSLQCQITHSVLNQNMPQRRDSNLTRGQSDIMVTWPNETDLQYLILWEEYLKEVWRNKAQKTLFPF